MAAYVKKYTKAERAERARQTLAKLKKENPEKFNPKKNGSAADKKNPPKKPEPKPEATPAPAPSAPTPEPEIPKATTAQILPGKKTVPAQPPASIATPSPSISGNASSPAIPDTQIFSESVPPPKIETGQAQPGPELKPGETPPPLNTPPPAPAGPTIPQSMRSMAQTVWGIILTILASIFGNEMFPRKVGKNAEAGEIPHDENEPVLIAWENYLASIGMKPLSPIMALWVAIIGYMIPRLEIIVNKIKAMFKKKPGVADRGAPAKENSESKETPGHKPAPATPAKTAPVPPTAPAPGEIEEPLADS